MPACRRTRTAGRKLQSDGDAVACSVPFAYMAPSPEWDIEDRKRNSSFIIDGLLSVAR